MLPFIVVQTQNIYHSNAKDTGKPALKIKKEHKCVMFSDLAELSCSVLRRPVSSVGRAWDSYIANQKCSRYPRVVAQSAKGHPEWDKNKISKSLIFSKVGFLSCFLDIFQYHSMKKTPKLYL